MTWAWNTWPFFLCFVSHVLCLVWASRQAMKVAARMDMMEMLNPASIAAGAAMKARVVKLRSALFAGAYQLEQVDATNIGSTSITCGRVAQRQRALANRIWNYQGHEDEDDDEDEGDEATH